MNDMIGYQVVKNGNDGIFVIKKKLEFSQENAELTDQNGS